MSRLDDIYRRVNEEISSNITHEKTASDNSITSDQIEALANQMKTASTEMDVQSFENSLFSKDIEGGAVQTLIEKIAHYQCMTEACLNIHLLTQLDALEKRAEAEGVPHEKTAQFIEKIAAKKYRPLGKMMPYLAALTGAGAAGAAGHSTGKKQGKEQGYGQALDDVNEAMKAYSL